MTTRAYYRKWRKKHPHYGRNRYRREKLLLTRFVVILGVKCRWKVYE